MILIQMLFVPITLLHTLNIEYLIHGNTLVSLNLTLRTMWIEVETVLSFLLEKFNIVSLTLVLLCKNEWVCFWGKTIS